MTGIVLPRGFFAFIFSGPGRERCAGTLPEEAAAPAVILISRQAEMIELDIIRAPKCLVVACTVGRIYILLLDEGERLQGFQMV